MYLLGQTAFLYKQEIHRIFTTRRCIVIYSLGTLLIASMYLKLPLTISFAYTNPLNVLMAFSLFFIFERREFHNKTINWISKSTLAVYILHCTPPPIISVLQKWDVFALQNYAYPAYLLLMIITIICVFVACIIYDKIRCMFMPKLGDIICNWLSNKTSKYSLTK